MKKRLFLLPFIACLSLSGCDLMDIINGKDEQDSKQELKIESIAISGELDKESYIQGESWDTTGLSVEASYDNNTTSTLDSAKYEFIFNEEKPLVGIDEIEITAHLLNSDIYSKPIEFEVFVDAPAIISLEIKGELNKTEYYEGETWNTDGLSVEATYSDQSKATLEPSKYEFLFSEPYADISMSEITITAHLLGSDINSEEIAYLVDVTRLSTIEKIEVLGNLAKTKYIENETWSSEGLYVKATYVDKTSATLSPSLYHFVFDPEKATLNTSNVQIKAILNSGQLESSAVSYNITVSEPPKEFTVSFNGNGATSGSMESEKVLEGSNYTVPGCAFTRTNYKFVDWALNSATGTKYAVNSVIKNITSNLTLYAIWEASASDEIDDDYGDYYSSISDSLSGKDLITALNKLNSSKRKRTMTYAGLKDYGQYTEIDWTGKDNKEGKMFGFYDNALICKTWDNQATWNREHVWPKSLGGGRVEGDMFMPRPCSVKINSDRGNDYYSKTAYDPGQFEANYRGVAARIIFYCAIADTSLKIIDENSGGSPNMGKLSDLLEWNLQYAPSRSANAHLTLRIEANRNKVMYSHPELQGNRNPFVDHPEYACKIWGTTNDATRKICGM